MPITAKEANRQIDWLMARLTGKRDRISGLLRRLVGMRPADKLKPSLFAKFLRMIDEIAAATQEENCLLGRIEHIEQKHLFFRRDKALKRVTAGVKQAANSNGLADERPKIRTSLGVLDLIVLWYVFMRSERNQKKQGLTAD
jgi:hypothetical protein